MCQTYRVNQVRRLMRWLMGMRHGMQEMRCGRKKSSGYKHTFAVNAFKDTIGNVNHFAHDGADDLVQGRAACSEYIRPWFDHRMAMATMQVSKNKVRRSRAPPTRQTPRTAHTAIEFLVARGEADTRRALPRLRKGVQAHQARQPHRGKISKKPCWASLAAISRVRCGYCTTCVGSSAARRCISRRRACSMRVHDARTNGSGTVWV